MSFNESYHCIGAGGMFHLFAEKAGSKIIQDMNF